MSTLDVKIHEPGENENHYKKVAANCDLLIQEALKLSACYEDAYASLSMAALAVSNLNHFTQSRERAGGAQKAGHFKKPIP